MSFSFVYVLHIDAYDSLGTLMKVYIIIEEAYRRETLGAKSGGNKIDSGLGQIATTAGPVLSVSLE